MPASDENPIFDWTAKDYARFFEKRVVPDAVFWTALGMLIGYAARLEVERDVARKAPAREGGTQ
jgi:hypothetical protein